MKFTIDYLLNKFNNKCFLCGNEIVKNRHSYRCGHTIQSICHLIYYEENVRFGDFINIVIDKYIISIGNDSIAIFDNANYNLLIKVINSNSNPYSWFLPLDALKEKLNKLLVLI